jgi:hypothetical protein
MKQASKFLVVAVVALSTSLLGSIAFAQHGGGGFHGGGGGFHGGGGFNGGGGFRGGWGWRGYYPWGFSFAYASSPYYYDPYYYYPPAYYAPTYYAPPVVYSSQSSYVPDSPPPDPKVIDVPQPPSTDRPLSPTAVDRDSPPPPPPTIQRGGQGQSIGVADVKALAKAGLSDEVILSHIRNSQAVYHLRTAEIIDLKNSGVSEKVIDFMINTASAPR